MTFEQEVLDNRTELVRAHYAAYRREWMSIARSARRDGRFLLVRWCVDQARCASRILRFMKWQDAGRR
jgi:hypothetical protein